MPNSVTTAIALVRTCRTESQQLIENWIKNSEILKDPNQKGIFFLEAIQKAEPPVLQNNLLFNLDESNCDLTSDFTKCYYLLCLYEKLFALEESLKEPIKFSEDIEILEWVVLQFANINKELEKYLQFPRSSQETFKKWKDELSTRIENAQNIYEQCLSNSQHKLIEKETEVKSRIETFSKVLDTIDLLNKKAAACDLVSHSLFADVLISGLKYVLSSSLKLFPSPWHILWVTILEKLFKISDVNTANYNIEQDKIVELKQWYGKLQEFPLKKQKDYLSLKKKEFSICLENIRVKLLEITPEPMEERAPASPADPLLHAYSIFGKLSSSESFARKLVHGT